MAPPRPVAPPPQAWQAAPRPIVRGVAPEAPPRVVLASPEELGIRAPIQDAQARARLAQLRAQRYESDRLPLGVYRVSFFLPDGAPIEAVGETEAAALQLALNRAEGLRNPQR